MGVSARHEARFPPAVHGRAGAALPLMLLALASAAVPPGQAIASGTMAGSGSETTAGTAGVSAGDAAALPPVVATALDAVTLAIEPSVLGQKRVRLAGIMTTADGGGAEAGDGAAAARDALARLVHGRRLRVVAIHPEPDRHGRLVAHVYRADDGRWLQGELVTRGLARVAFASDAESLRLLPLEDEARRAGRGPWGDRRQRVLASDEVGRHLGEIVIVEGVVRRVARAGGWLYLNFGGDWRRDFTASVRARVVPAFVKAGVPLADLAGRRVRVRGFLDQRHGPSLELFERTQIEVLVDDGSPPVIPPAAAKGPGDAPPGR